MPMCRSPRIADVLLRAKTAHANDNHAPVDKRVKPVGPESVFKAAWPALLIFLCIIAFLVFELAVPL